MNWPMYLYLLPVGIVAVFLLAAMAKNVDTLTVDSVKRTRSELIFLGAILLVGTAAIYGNFVFGPARFAYLDVGSDTSNQYVPYYLNLLSSIRNGTLGLWNFQYGLGVSFMSYQSWTLDPFNLVLIPLGLAFGNSALSYILVFIQALKIVLCGYLFDHILTYHCEKPASRILGASLFAFCGYLMLWGQHYWLGTVLVMATLETLLIEKLLERWSVPGFLGMAAVTAVTVMMSTYSGFMVMLYAATYAVLRTIATRRPSGFASFIKVFVPLAIPVICGLIVSCITVIPYATLLLGESSRVGGSSDVSTSSKAIGYLTSFVPLKWIPAIFSKLLGNGLFCVSSDIPESLIPPTSSFDTVNTYEFIQLGFSCGAIMLIAQFYAWANKALDRRTKILIAVASALCVLYCFNYFLPALSNVFVNPKYRSSFALCTPICIAMALGFEKCILDKQIQKPLFIASFALTISVIGWSLVNSVDGKLGSSVSALCAVIFFCVVLVASQQKGFHAFVPMAIAALVVSSVFDGFMVTNRRTWATSETFPDASRPQSSTETQEALSWIRSQDDGLYRVEKLYIDWTRLDDSLIEGYSGIASYNSTLDSDVIDFYRQLWPNMLVGDSAYQEYINDPDHPELLRMLGVKYLLSHDDLDFPWVRELNRIGNTRIYEVNEASGIATVKAGSISESDAGQMSPEGRESSLTACVIVPDQAHEQLVDSGPVTVPYTDENAYSVVGANGAATPWAPAPAKLDLRSSSLISGTVTALADNSVVCLAIPHTSGWKVFVDGSPAETYRANYGFIGFTVSAGEHSIEAYYEAPNAKISVMIGSAGIVLTVLSCFVEVHRNRADRQS